MINLSVMAGVPWQTALDFGGSRLPSGQWLSPKRFGETAADYLHGLCDLAVCISDFQKSSQIPKVTVLSTTQVFSEFRLQTSQNAETTDLDKICDNRVNIGFKVLDGLKFKQFKHV